MEFCDVVCYCSNTSFNSVKLPAPLVTQARAAAKAATTCPLIASWHATRARYPRTLANLKQAVRLAGAALLHDSEAVLPGAHRLITACEGASTQVLYEPLPAWAKKMLGMGR